MRQCFCKYHSDSGFKRRQLLPSANQDLDGGQEPEDTAVSWKHEKIIGLFLASAVASSRGNRNRSTKQHQPKSKTQILGALQTPSSQAPVTQIPFSTEWQYPLTFHLVQIWIPHSKTTLECEIEHIKDRTLRRFVHQSNVTLKELQISFLRTPYNRNGRHIIKADSEAQREPSQVRWTNTILRMPSRPQSTANWGCKTGLCNAMKPTAQKPGWLSCVGEDAIAPESFSLRGPIKYAHLSLLDTLPIL